MKTKAAITVLLFLMGSVYVNAQNNNKFIEIMATDSIELKPVAFVYQVSSGPDLSMFPVKMDKTDNEPYVSLSTIKKVLDKNNFTYEAKGKENYTIGGDKTPDSVLLITLNSDTELKRLYKALVNVKSISGKISDVKFESISAYKPDMYQRLYTKALTDATTLAKVSGNSVGQLISVQEPQQGADFFSGYQQMLQKMTGPNNFLSQLLGLETGLTQKIETKLLFRFELK